jgi:hypothetical protein
VYSDTLNVARVRQDIHRTPVGERGHGQPGYCRQRALEVQRRRENSAGFGEKRRPALGRFGQ